MRLFPLVLICSAFLPLAGAASAGESAPSAVLPAPRDVRAVAAAVTDYQPSIDITGSIAARIQSDLSFRTSGRVTDLLADVGDHVRKGDVLARIDNTEQRAEVEISRAKLQSAQATRVQKQLSFDRYQSLLQSKAISQATFDQAKEDLVTAQGSEETAKANLATSEDELAYTELKADADGIITARNIEVGQVVSAAQAALTLAHDGPRDAEFNVFEAMFLDGPPIPEVDVAPVDATERVRTRVREVSPALDTSTGTIRVKVTLPDSAQWSLGTPVKGEFRAAPRSGVVVPWSALTSERGQPAVWIIDPQTKLVALRRVKVALYRTGEVVIADGVKPAELVVTQGGQFLRDGQPVTWENVP